MQEHDIHPRSWSLGDAMRTANSHFPGAARATLPWALLIAVCVHLGSGDHIPLGSAGELFVVALVGIALGGLVMMAYVAMTRRLAPVLGISPRPIAWGAVFVTGVIVMALTIAGFVALVIPGIIAAIGLSLITPIVAFEGVTGADAVRASWRTMRAGVGATVGLAFIAIVVPTLLDPATWGMQLAPPLLYAWQLVLWTTATIYGALLASVACMHARGGTSAPVAQLA